MVKSILCPVSHHDQTSQRPIAYTKIHYFMFQPNASWIWGHEKLIFNSSVGSLYLRWLKEMGSVIRIKGALWVCQPLSKV